jgi:hypothetical protein
MQKGQRKLPFFVGGRRVDTPPGFASTPRPTLARYLLCNRL